jgi:KDO2-lipid IV(A) lauroyltransferase
VKDIKEFQSDARKSRLGMGVLRIAMRLLAMLPLRATQALGAALGWAMYFASPRYRRLLRDNLAQAGYTEAKIRREAIASAGEMLTELPTVWLRSREVAVGRVRRTVGMERVDEARRRGQSIVFLTPHYGCFEIAAQAMAEHVPMAILYRPPKLAALEPLMERGRAKRNLRLARADYGGVRELVEALRRGEAVGMLPDQVPGVGEGEWAEFFGRPAYSMTLAAKLIARPDTVGLLVRCERLPAGRGYIMHVDALPEPLPGESGVRRINRAIELLIRQRPGQYLWSYNRYKAPRGAPPPPPERRT